MPGADLVDQRMAVTPAVPPFGLHVGFESQFGLVLLEQPFQSVLRETEGFERISPHWGFERRGKRLLRDEARKQQQRLQDVALARGVRTHQHHERSELDVYIEERFKALDAKSAEHSSSLSRSRKVTHRSGQSTTGRYR